MKVCTLYIAKPVLILYLFLVVAWPGVGIVGIIASWYGAFGPDYAALWAFVPVLGLALFNFILVAEVSVRNQVQRRNH